jgi:hypothetical protein
VNEEMLLSSRRRNAAAMQAMHAAKQRQKRGRLAPAFA